MGSQRQLVPYVSGLFVIFVPSHLGWTMSYQCARDTVISGWDK